MKNLLLSIIAICLTLITVRLYIPEAVADVAGMNYSELRRDRDFRKAVEYVVNSCSINGGYADVNGDGPAHTAMNDKVAELLRSHGAEK